MANRGFPKGHIPYNKGKHYATRSQYAQKGRQGFLKRPIYDIAQDGSIARKFSSVSECQQALGIKSSRTISRAFSKNQLCAGHRLIYQDEWSPLGDYHWLPTPGRNKDGTFKKEHHLSRMFASRQNKETKEKIRQRARQRNIEMHANPKSKWGKLPGIPILCITTGIQYKSFKEAAEQLGIPQNQISSAVARCGTVRKLKFIKITPNTVK